MDCAGRAIAPYTHFHFGRFFRTPVPPHPNPLPKERESHSSARRKIETLRMVPNRTTILPLLGERVGVRGNGLHKAVGVPLSHKSQSAVAASLCRRTPYSFDL